MNGRFIMFRRYRGVAVLLAMVVCSGGGLAARAETKPSLDAVVRRDVLIVKCKIELKEEEVLYRVLETWKGVYDPKLFDQIPPKGYLHKGISAQRFSSVTEGEEVILFYSDNAISGDRLNPGKIDAYRPDDVLGIDKGKIEYRRGELVSEEYTLTDFKKAVLAIVAQQAKEQAAAAK